MGLFSWVSSPLRRTMSATGSSPSPQRHKQVLPKDVIPPQATDMVVHQQHDTQRTESSSPSPPPEAPCSSPSLAPSPSIAPSAPSSLLLSCRPDLPPPVGCRYSCRHRCCQRMFHALGEGGGAPLSSQNVPFRRQGGGLQQARGGGDPGARKYAGADRSVACGL